jgi:integrase
MKRKRLSAKAVEQMKRSGLHHDSNGLYLQVSPTRAKSWLFRYTRYGKAHAMGLGSLKGVSLKRARRLTSDAHELLSQGIDPIQDRRAKRAVEDAARANSVSFKKCAETYIETHAPSWRNHKHKGQWAATLTTYAYPLIGQKPVSEITTDDVLAILQPLWSTKTETAKRLQQRLAVILDWSRVRGYRSSHNVAQWKGHLDKLLAKPGKIKKVRHHPAIPVAEVGAFMAALGKREGIAARALEFLCLTTTRSGEVRGATWVEIDLQAGVWTIPAERMKSHRPHRVPLSADAVALLEALPRFENVEYVFPNTRGGPLSDMTLSAIMRRMNVPGVPHGLRSTFRDWCSENLIPGELAEQALAHVVASKVEAAYRRTDLYQRRHDLMQRWADHCRGEGAKVLKIAESKGAA